MTYTHSGYQIVTSLSACLSLSVALVALRFGGRWYKKRAPLLSDYFVLVALGAFIAYAGVLFKMVDNPSGTVQPTEVTGPYAFSTLSIITHLAIITELLLILIITLVKISILLFYQAIFINTVFRRVNAAAMAICVIWFLVVFFVLLFQCSPVAAGWDLLVLISGAQCLSLPTIILGLEVTNICIDVLIMVLPSTEMRKLQMKRSRKITICCVFAVGGFVAITSALRIAFSRPHGKLGSATIVNFTQTYVWTNIQIAAAIICACLPTLPALLPSSLPNVSSIGSWLAGFVSNRSLLRSRQSHEKSEEPGVLEKAAPASVRSVRTMSDEENAAGADHVDHGI